MNDAQKQAKEYAEILLAFSRGEKVEYRETCSSEWKKPTLGPVWQFASNEYRVAPKPVERWAVINPDHSLDFYFTKQEATRDLFHKEDGARVILLREVTE